MEQWNCRLVPTGELYRENESESANTLHVVPIQRWSHCHQHSRQLPVENVSIKFRSTGPEDEAHDFNNFWLQDQIRVRRLGSSVEYWQLNSWDLANCTREWTLCSRGQTFFFFVFQCWAPERNLWTLRRSPKMSHGFLPLFVFCVTISRGPVITFALIDGRFQSYKWRFIERNVWNVPLQIIAMLAQKEGVAHSTTNRTPFKLIELFQKFGYWTRNWTNLQPVKMRRTVHAFDPAPAGVRPVFH